jgi:hypothetical protein
LGEQALGDARENGLAPVEEEGLLSMTVAAKGYWFSRSKSSWLAWTKCPQ